MKHVRVAGIKKQNINRVHCRLLKRNCKPLNFSTEFTKRFLCVVVVIVVLVSLPASVLRFFLVQSLIFCRSSSCKKEEKIKIHTHLIVLAGWKTSIQDTEQFTYGKFTK